MKNDIASYIPADVKSYNGLKRQEIKDVSSTYKFFCSKLEIQCKRGMYFSFDFNYFIHFDIVCLRKVGWGGGGGGNLKRGKSYLSTVPTY